MNIETLSIWRRWCLRATLPACAVWIAIAAVPAGATRVVVGAETTVRTIRFEGAHAISETKLRAMLHTQSRGSAWGLRTLLGRLPLVPAPSAPPFDPLVLQEDVVRLRNRYADAGFLGTWVRYEVAPVGGEDLIDITFVVDEGKPVRIADVTIQPPDLPVPPELRKEWENIERRARGMIGRRLDADDVRAERSRMESWWRDAGFAGATVTSAAERDSVQDTGRVRYTVDAGRRWRFGAILVDGNEAVSDRVVQRELPFEPGNLYSLSAVDDGRRDLQQLQIVRASRIEVARPADVDSTAASAASLPVRVTVTEAKPRLIAGDIGYVTEAGLSSNAQWSHRNFTGSARVLTVSGLAQTSWLAVQDNPDRRYRGAVSLQQPYVFHRRLSAVVSPFVEYREDYSDRSREYGSNVTLVYRVRPLLSASVDYRVAERKIFEYRLGELAVGAVDLLTFAARVAQGEAAGTGARIKSSLFTLSVTAGDLDDMANPRFGILARPSWQITAPTPLSSASYSRADGSLYGFLPVSRHFTVAGRFTAGRLYPFGKSIPAPGEDPLLGALALRDVSFTAGGSTDVRGWSYRMLGPKFPDVRLSEQGDSLVASASGYVPVGGLSRMSFTVELRMPLPPLGPSFGSHVFLDGGRVWTSDQRFVSGADTFEEERTFYATGAGLDFLTPVGSIRLSVGYKLNPSLPDLVDSGSLLQALLDGTSTDALERHEGRRWQFNLAIGASY